LEQGKKKLPFSGAMADINQQNFDVANTINGKLDRSDLGWAVHPGVNRPHWARYGLQTPFKAPAGAAAKLNVRIYCRYSNNDYPLGCFRLWTTDSDKPLDLGLPGDIAAVLAKPAEQRTAEDQKALQAHAATRDEDILRHNAQLAKAKAPVAPDAQDTAMRAALAKAESPVADADTVVSLRSDLAQSKAQRDNHRLTAAQDLAWALINNASFLFNR
jgi:hypothetical protein